MKTTYWITGLFLICTAGWAQDITHQKFHNIEHLAFISSQVPVDITGSLVSTNIEEQVQQTFENLVNTAEEAGAVIENGKIKNVVKLTIYLTNIEDLNYVDKYSLNYLAGTLPARTPLGGINYGKTGYLISMDAIVEIP